MQPEEVWQIFRETNSIDKVLQRIQEIGQK